MLKKDFFKNYWLSMILFFSFICVPVLGDGIAFKGNDYHSLMPISEKEQRAVIIYNNGIEKLLIAVSLELESEDKALWIFPLPSDPNKIKTEVVDSFPNFTGENPHNQVKELINRAFNIALSTQIYTMPFSFMLFREGAKYTSLGTSESIIIHNQIDKWGIHSETVSAKSVEALEKYLETKEVNIDSNQMQVFEGYLSQNYALVIAWISSKQELMQNFPEYKADNEMKKGDKSRWPCLFVEFPVKKAFYPLVPTNGSENEYTMVHILVKGMVEPDADIFYFRHRLFPEYYTQKGLPENTPDVLKEDLSNDRMFYTAIHFNLRGGEPVDDLWLDPCRRKDIIYADRIASFGENKIIFFVFTAIIILFLSYLCAGFAGLLLFGKWRGYSVIGLWNILTLIGVYLGTKIIKGKAGDRLKDSDRFPGRWMFIVVFSILYLVAVAYFNGIIFELIF